jgi:hypothetical protein
MGTKSFRKKAQQRWTTGFTKVRKLPYQKMDRFIGATIPTKKSSSLFFILTFLKK